MGPAHEQPEWLLIITPEENAVDSLERAADFLADRERATWPKWVSLALHHALYGFLICAVRGTDPHRVTTGRRGQLIGFPQALRRAQDDSHMQQYTFSKTLVLSPRETRSIDFLAKGLRNQFQHLAADVWGIDLRELPETLRDVLRVVEFLALNSGNVLWHRPGTRERAECTIKRMSGALERLSL